MDLQALELCAGAGGTALGLERAGFAHFALVEIDADACATLRANRPSWRVYCEGIEKVNGHKVPGLALISAGLPCTPHSRGGQQLGAGDERHLWDCALRIIGQAQPAAVMLETADAILTPKFDDERAGTLTRLAEFGYRTDWRVVDCSDYGVPQRRRRAILAGFRDDRAASAFAWPEPSLTVTVGETLADLMGSAGWPGAAAWAAAADGLAPVVVGGSRKHGGADLGASQGKQAWRRLGIDPMGIAEEPPAPDGKQLRSLRPHIIRDVVEDGGPMLTVSMAAAIQGFPAHWTFAGLKTSAYRQVGNSFPPPAAHAIGEAIRSALAAI